MQRVLPTGVASADRLELREVPVPEPGSGEVRVWVNSVPVNARDETDGRHGRGRRPDRGARPAPVIDRTFDLGEVRRCTQWPTAILADSP